MEKLELENMNISQLKNKTKNLKKKFTDITNWLNRTGQGVDDGDIESL